MDDQSENPSRDLDARIAARVFGVTYERIHGDYCIPDPEDAIAYLACPHYSTDIAAAFDLEERLVQLGVAEAYAYALVELVLAGSAFGFLNRGAYEKDIFAIAHASATQRCIAALRALERKRPLSE